MIASKNKIVLSAMFLLLISNIGNSSFAGPLRRIAKMEMEKKMQKEKFVLYSSAFKNGERIPTQYTADGANVSPPLEWGTPLSQSTAPAGTKSFALICEDPDAPMGTFTHWIIYDIPASIRALVQATPAEASLTVGTKQGTNSFHKIGYNGPSPPAGKPHRYYFKLYALNSISNLPPAIDAKQFHTFIQAHTVAESDLMGTYGR